MAISRVPPYWMVTCPGCGREVEVQVKTVLIRVERLNNKGVLSVQADAQTIHECR